MQLFERKRRTPGVSLTPLIDILFLLIIFFVVSSRLESEFGVGMQLPESVQGQSNTATLVLEMQESGDVLLDSVRTSRDALPQALGELREKRPKEDLLTLKIDRRIAHGEVVALMDLAREAGFQKVAFGVNPPSSGANAPR